MSKKDLHISIFSFGYKYGMPDEVNYLFDVRFLPNPYWAGELRDKNGLEPDVADYVLKSRAGEQFFGRFLDFVQALADENAGADKEKMVIAVGCTGGRHRSVAVAEKLARELKTDIPVKLEHRDIEKDVSIR
ncbi:MAG: hypothetical protein CSB24_06745 [Deltaproteobacteria bacterium]|nr:MAG: hypothetical protein CSB24_06745 [Deltaproteobacteria bacterium]